VTRCCVTRIGIDSRRTSSSGRAFDQRQGHSGDPNNGTARPPRFRLGACFLYDIAAFSNALDQQILDEWTPSPLLAIGEKKTAPNISYCGPRSSSRLSEVQRVAGDWGWLCLRSAKEP
jgi:hypothetical protein